ncbi:MAG: MATE family efflux transporter [Campylobacterales bacterium]|nr:MATE family efflux transporter [Campylobacterales bacterium]
MTYKEYLVVALPLVLSTITQPLLGAVDTAVIGHLNEAAFIGGVAIGTVILNTLYWLFGFLRVSTSGFSAQALGSGVAHERALAYFRPLVLALGIGMVFVLLQTPILQAAFVLYQPEALIFQSAHTYFSILIWGAPLVLLGYVNLGWIMGQRLIRQTLLLQISTNVLNIVLDILFVVVWDFGVAGVAYATLIALTYSFVMGCWIVSRVLDVKQFFSLKAELLEVGRLKKMLSVNADLMIRTACLLIMTNLFIAKGNRFGAELLAANAILFQLQYIICYFYDGLANASSIFTGKAAGAKDKQAYARVLHISNVMIGWVTVLIALVFLVAQEEIVGLFTNIAEVQTLCLTYMGWIVLFPFVIGTGLVYYGIYTGATFTKPVRDSMIVALFVFLVAFFSLIPPFGNHGLWAAFILFSLVRSVYLYQKKEALEKSFAFS